MRYVMAAIERLKGRRPEPANTASDNQVVCGVRESDEGPVTALKEYLDYYRSLDSPHYAVLVKGDWGTGKTFQVRRALPEGMAYYVSLFGLNSADDVIAAIYTAMFPNKAWLRKLASGVGETTAEIKGVGSLAVSGLTSALVGAFLRQEVANDKPIVFDDLERCGLRVAETLGIINLYVEHHGCRVIVISHDEKLTNEFAEAKEKIFGQTIRVEPQIVSAFDAFHSTLREGPEKDLIARQRNNIIDVFTESGVNSLRILRHVIEDLSRLLASVNDAHRACDAAMNELVRLFSALDIEWRVEAVHAPDLRKRRDKELGYGMRAAAKGEAAEVPAIVSANKRFSLVDLTSDLLQDDVLVQMFVEGNFDKLAIQNSLNASPYFIKPQDAEPWRIVLNFDDLEDEVVNSAVARMQEQFEKREITDSGEMLHVFALRMMMAKHGILDKDVGAVTAECHVYIDDLLNQGRLPPRGFDYRWADEFSHGAYHVMFWVSDDYQEQFNEVYQHLLAAREKALDLELPQMGTELLELVETAGEKFFQKVCYTKAGDNKFASIPVLAAIDPREFVAAWMRSPKSNWHWICGALNSRYKAGVVNVNESEHDWAGQVVKLLNEAADQSSGLAKLRIRRVIPILPGNG